MRRAANENYELVSRVRITVRWPDDTEVAKAGRNDIPRDKNILCDVVLRPNDSEFADLLNVAGISLPPPSDRTADDGASRTYDSGIESLLDNLDDDPPQENKV
jgi:hypothetical protein